MKGLFNAQGLPLTVANTAASLYFLGSYSKSFYSITNGCFENPVAELCEITRDGMERLGVEVNYFGEIPKDKKILFASNHVSWLDGTLVAAPAAQHMKVALAGAEHLSRNPVTRPFTNALARQNAMYFVPRLRDIRDGITKIEGITPKSGRLSPDDIELLYDVTANGVSDILNHASLVLFPEGFMGDATDISKFSTPPFRALFDENGRAIQGRVAQPVVIDIRMVEGQEITPGCYTNLRDRFAQYGMSGYSHNPLMHLATHIMKTKRDDKRRRMVIDIHYLPALDPKDFVGGTRAENGDALGNTIAKMVRHYVLYPPRSKGAPKYMRAFYPDAIPAMRIG